MKKVYNRALLLLLAVLLVLPLASCQPEVPPQKITIEEDPAYSDETLRWAEETILSLVSETYSKAATDKISETMEARLQKWAHGICRITTANPIPEEKYRCRHDPQYQKLPEKRSLHQEQPAQSGPEKRSIGPEKQFGIGGKHAEHEPVCRIFIADIGKYPGSTQLNSIHDQLRQKHDPAHRNGPQPIFPGWPEWQP